MLWKSSILRPSVAPIIGITTMSMTLRACRDIITAVRADHPQGIVVVGGSHVNAQPEIVKHIDADYGFRGECEFTFTEFKAVLRLATVGQAASRP